ncbi:MAG: OsmC family protein [Sphingomonadales bacterium]|nr:OsmC family protein [Sphingomonadales bacterium]
MKAHVQWAGDLTFLGYGASKHAVVMDGGENAGGLGVGTSPMEMLMLGAGGCACIDVVMILEKSRQKITDVSVEVSGSRADEPPRVFTDIHMSFLVKGRNLKDSQVARAVELSMTKYCSASQTLARACSVTHDYRIEEDQ